MKIITIVVTSCQILRLIQFRLRLELRPRPCWGRLQRSPRPLAGFKGLLLTGGKGKEGVGKEVPSTFLCGSTRMYGLYLRRRIQLLKRCGGHASQSRRQRGSDDQYRSRRRQHALCQLVSTVSLWTACQTVADSQTTVLSTAPSTRHSHCCTLWSVPKDRRTDQNIPSRDLSYLYSPIVVILMWIFT